MSLNPTHKTCSPIYPLSVRFYALRFPFHPYLVRTLTFAFIMHSSRSDHPPSAARRPSLVLSELSTAAASPPSQHTSLPSIRHLHPFLSTSSMALPEGSSNSSYNYPPPPQFAHQSHQVAHHEQQQQQLAATQRDSDGYGGVDSDMEDIDHQGPPKKKRRRQALSCTGMSAIVSSSCRTVHSPRFSSMLPSLTSCVSLLDPMMHITRTECKRRKIKCDRCDS